jgi:hypothetical protein
MWRKRGPGAARRLKTYSAQTGYVYEYFFVNQAGHRYRFDVSATRKDYAPVVVEIDQEELTRAAARELSAVEEYAIAKMSLLQAFDEREPSALATPVKPTRADFDGILTTLDLI